MSQRIAIVVSRFNEEITQQLLDGALQCLKEKGWRSEDVQVKWVPGAVEIPLMAQQMAATHSFAAVIALGCVIRGETDHYDYVCQQVSYGCQKVALTFSLPVIFGVLTTHTEEQALARSGGEHSDKGRECVLAALEMIEALPSKVSV